MLSFTKFIENGVDEVKLRSISTLNSKIISKLIKIDDILNNFHEIIGSLSHIIK